MTTEFCFKESFWRWLARQPDEREFNFFDLSGCLFCAFAKEELGWKGVRAGGEYVKNACGEEIEIPLPFADAAARPKPLTIANFKRELAKQLHREKV